MKNSETGWSTVASLVRDDSNAVRLDALVASRGLARSRTAAARLIHDGCVTVAGAIIVKPSAQVPGDIDIVVGDHDEWVSRAAPKLLGALTTFAVDPTERVVLDVGASTGGFTEVLLAKGAARVIALDVGHDQLAPTIRQSDKVAVVEGCNARTLTPDRYHSLDAESPRTSLVVGDLSFISLRIVMPALAASVPADEWVLLVKPQFEVGRSGVREGIVHDPAQRADAVLNVLWAAWDNGFGTAGFAPSPVVGTHGNHEYLAHFLRSGGANPTEWIERVTETTARER